jgi:hypothetical protein
MLSSRELPMPIGLDHLSRNDLNPTVLRGASPASSRRASER